MSMFGLFYAGLEILSLSITKIENIINDCTNKSRAKNRKAVAYYDHNGAYRLISTDEAVHYDKLPNGERVLCNITNKVVYNFDENQRQKDIEDKNRILHKISPEIDLVGIMADIYPTNMKNIYSNGIYKNTNIYKYNNKLYIRIINRGYFLPKYLYCDIENQKWTILNQKISDDNIDKVNEYLLKRNRLNEEYGRIYVTSKDWIR